MDKELLSFEKAYYDRYCVCDSDEENYFFIYYQNSPSVKVNEEKLIKNEEFNEKELTTQNGNSAVEDGNSGQNLSVTTEDIELSFRNIGRFSGEKFDDLDLLVKFGQIKFLDISGNKFLRLYDTLKTCSRLMPNLERLNLRSSIEIGTSIYEEGLKLTPNIDGEDDMYFNNLTFLNLGSTKTSWNFFLSLSSKMPALEEVILSYNDINFINCKKAQNPEQLNSFKTLKCIDLSDNKIEDLRNVDIMRQFPKLETLILSNNCVTHISKDLLLPNSLKTLHLDGNNISSINDIINLNDHPNIENFRLLRNPIFEDLDSTQRRLIKIALLSNAKLLEGSLISNDKLRVEAELFYIWHCEKHFYKALQLKKVPRPEEFVAENPMYVYMCNKHDRKLIYETLKNPGDVLKPLQKKLIKLLVYVPELTSPSLTLKTISVLPSMKVCELKVLLEKIMRWNTSNIINLWIETQAPKTKFNLTDLDSHTLSSFYIPDNSIIHLNPI